MTTVDPLLVAEIEVAMRIPVCANFGCDLPTAWSLVAPCGHATGLCDICHMDWTETIERAVDAGESFVCARDGMHGLWAEFQWVATP